MFPYPHGHQFLHLSGPGKLILEHWTYIREIIRRQNNNIAYLFSVEPLYFIINCYSSEFRVNKMKIRVYTNNVKSGVPFFSDRVHTRFLRIYV